MASRPQPTEAPPSYQEAQATGTSTTSQPNRTSHLEVPQAVNGIPAAHRRSMEDELRPLPTGFIRQFDEKERHQFFVDTRQDPPVSSWQHPLDDKEILASLSSEERERLQEEEEKMKRPITPTSIDEKDLRKDSHTPHEIYPPLPQRPDGRASIDQGKKKGFGERFKEKVTGLTKEERQQEKAKQAQLEREYYETHMRFRSAMTEAQRTQQPVFFAKDRDGHDVYIEPPNYGYGAGYGGRYINPYGPGSPYSNPNARFIRPQQAYGRPYGYGPYGGGTGLGLPIAGGLLGGALLGGLLF